MPSCLSRLRPLAAVFAFGLALHLGAAPTPEGEDAAAGSSNTPWWSPGLRFQAPSPIGERYAPTDVRWQRQGESSFWFARVSMASAPAAQSAAAAPGATALQGEAQWLYRGWDQHAVRLGASGRQDLLPTPTQTQAGTLGAFVQDDWSLAPGWRASFALGGETAAAARSALTPRAVLSWQMRPDMEVRLVDGVDWRDAQSSLSSSMSAVTPTLLADGVRLRATEVALNWQALSDLRLSASLRRQRDDEATAAVASGSSLPATLRFQSSAPSSAGDGVGLDGAYAVEEWRLRSRWSAFQPRDESSSDGALRMLAALQAQVPLPWHGASAGLEWLRLDQRAGAAGTAALTQTLINATLAWTPAGSPWSLAANAYNLADHALDDAAGGEALVREGRRWQLQVSRPF